MTSNQTTKANPILFWGCFIALIATAFGFVGRLALLGVWGEEFGLDGAQVGRLAGIGIWPFAVSIIFFSLIIDRIGYKVAMIFAFLGHIIWAIMGVSAYFVSKNGNTDGAYQLLYWGSLILALGNGTVEAFINPVVATMFSKDKTKWLNILHAGWPGGLVITGILTIIIANMNDVPWWVNVGLIAIPAVVYFLMLIGCKFPVNERVGSGVTYKEMLSEFGILGALVVGFLVTLQLTDFFSNGNTVPLAMWQKALFAAIGIGIVVAFGAYTRSLGRPLMFLLTLIMMPLATTEIGTDGWITAIMESVAEGKFHPAWVLVYTSAIMMVLRFFAGPIIKAFSPLGLLAVSAVFAIIGLYTLSFTQGMIIFAAATLYGIGKTFFWPTMLGVVAEQTPKGGALTLNAISGIGMLAVGTLGFPYIGALQENKSIAALETPAYEIPVEEVTDGVTNMVMGTVGDLIHKVQPDLFVDGEFTAVTNKAIYEVIKYTAVDANKIIGDEVNSAVGKVKGKASQSALASMAIFPVIMLIAYLGLIAYFKSKGGYKPIELADGTSSSSH